MAGLLFRAIAFFAEPVFSDDLYRYQWEGRLQIAGGNPYTSYPAQAEWKELQGTQYERIEGKPVRAVYGPLVLLTERAAAYVEAFFGGEALWAYKIPGMTGDLLLLWLLFRQGHRSLLLYALHPVVIVECSGMGHHDGLLLPFLFWLCVHHSPLAFGTLVWAKWWPALFGPALLLQIGWRRFWPALLPAILVLPFLKGLSFEAVTTGIDFTTGFLGGWQNNAGLFRLVEAVTPSSGAAKIAAAGLIAIGATVMALLPGIFLRRARAIVLWLLAWSANVHAWYLTWLLPLAAAGEPGTTPTVPALRLALLSAAAPMLHVGLLSTRITGQWQYSGWWTWLFWLLAGLILWFPAGRIPAFQDGDATGEPAGEENRSRPRERVS